MQLIDGRDPFQEWDPCDYDYHGCNCPSGNPPCSHCVDCWICSVVCYYCGDEHEDKDDNGEECPQIKLDIAMLKLLGYT